MRKILVVLLITALLGACLPGLCAGAASGELLQNGGFETGTTANFVRTGTSTATVSAAGAHSGSFGLTLTNRSGQYATYQQTITDVIRQNGSGKYQASVWLKLAPGETRTAKALLVINYRYQGESNDHYITSGSYVTLTTSWQQLTISNYVDYDNANGMHHITIYPQVIGDNAEGPSFCADELTLVKVSDGGNVPTIPASVTDRPEKTTFGAIRWDAWFGHKNTTSGVCVQVERSLSPAKYHWRAPFFATVTSDNKIYIPEYTQEIFDQEMRYAIEAGIDYFAYVWYKDDMRLAHTFHSASPYRNQVKMCACLDGNAINKDYARKEITALFGQSHYMTVLNGRPLMYYFASGNNADAITADILYYRSYCADHGFPAPYAVVMNVEPVAAFGMGGDACSSYAFGGNNGQTYASMLTNLKNKWESWRKSGKQFVPNLTAGWHNLPRYENPVSWTTSNASSWAQYATADEIAAHVTDALNYMKRSDVKGSTIANTMILYGWNEHDEGGWICPTIAVDENGRQLYNADGTKKIDDSRIKAVGQAIRAFYGYTPQPTVKPTTAPTAKPTATPTVKPTAVPTATPTLEPTAAPTETPTAAPTDAPTDAPTAAPTANPTEVPTSEPTEAVTAAPTNEPTAAPVTGAPTADPTTEPKSSGCGSAILPAALVSAAVTAIFIKRKKENQ